MPQDNPEAYLDPTSPYYDPSKAAASAKPSLYYNPAKHPASRTRSDPAGNMDMLLAALAKALSGGGAPIGQQAGGVAKESGAVDYATTPDEPPEELSEEEADAQMAEGEPAEEDEFVTVVQDAAGHALDSGDFGEFLNSQEGATVYDIYENEGMTPGTADQVREAYKLYRSRRETVPDDLIQREGKSDSLNRMF